MKVDTIERITTCLDGMSESQVTTDAQASAAVKPPRDPTWILSHKSTCPTCQPTGSSRPCGAYRRLQAWSLASKQAHFVYFNGHDPAARRAWSIASKHDSVKTERRGQSDAQASSMARSMASKHESRGLDATAEVEADVAPLRQPCCMPARLECLLSGAPRVPAIRRDC